MRTFKKILVTGGAGFIGSNFIRHVLKNQPKLSVVNLDKLTYAGNIHSLEDVERDYPSRYSFIKGDICDRTFVEKLVPQVDAIVNFAAESHVDRSIVSGFEFVKTNVEGTYVLLDVIRTLGHQKRFLQISTDEVYGTLDDSGAFFETTPLAPNSPYSASKASADCFIRAFHETHKLDAVITRCSNNYGAYQFPEKLIPLMITNALNDEPLPVYGKGLNIRDWIHVEDHCEGIWCALTKGRSGEVYNLGGRSEVRNIDVVKQVLKILGKSESLIRFVEDRKGHDYRYAIDCTKAEKELGWSRRYRFEEGLEQTVHWYLENKKWWQDIKSGAYR